MHAPYLCGRAGIEVWLSLVERHVRDVEAVGSSPVTSTTSDDAGSKVALDSALFYCLFSDEGAAYAYFCRTEMHEVHKKGTQSCIFIYRTGW